MEKFAHLQMKNILIVCFSDRFDLLLLSNLASSIYSHSLETNISLCIYKEDFCLVKDLKYVAKYFVLDKERITDIKSNKKIPEAHALNYFASFMTELKNYCWDYVFNLAEDELGVLITSFLDPKKFGGKKITRNHTTSYSSNWAFLDSMFSKYDYSSIHRIDLWHKILNVSWKNHELKINTDPERNQYMAQLLAHYREQIYLQKRGSKLVAILIDGLESKYSTIDYDVICELVDELINSRDFHPILIMTSKVDDKLKHRYQSKFSEKILIKLIDEREFSSFLINIDVLVTTDNIAQAIANLVNTSTVRVILDGSENIYNIGPICTGDIIIKTKMASQDDLGDGSYEKVGGKIGANDLLLGIQVTTEQIINKNSIGPSEGIFIYQVLRDKMGVWYRPIIGDVDTERQMTLLMSRLFIMRIFENDTRNEILNYIISFFDQEKIYNWIDQERDQILTIAKMLLETIRNLKLVNRLHDTGALFVKNLEALLCFGNSKNLVSIPSNIFKQKVDTIIAKSTEENIREVEMILNEFKMHLHVLATSLTDLTFLDYTKRGGNFVEKTRF